MIPHDYASLMEEKAISFLKDLVSIPAPTGKESRRAQFLLSFLHANGVEEAYLDEGGNVLCPFGSGKKDYVVFSAHLDTVFEEESIVIKEEGTLLKAPGIGDDGANLVNLVIGLLYTKAYLPDAPFLFAFTVGEEGLGNLKGVRKVFADWAGRIKRFYSFDLYVPYVYATPVGSHRYEIQVVTQGGHSFGDFGRPNAIVEASLLIGELSKLEVSGEPKTTWNVGEIHGGTTVNSIASSCSFLYEYRSTDEGELQRMKKAMEEVLGMHQKDGVTITFKALGERPAMGSIDAQALSAMTRETEALVKRIFQEEPVLSSISSDSNLPLSLGIPANTLGSVRGGGAHTKEEWIDSSSMGKGMELVISLLSLNAKR